MRRIASVLALSALCLTALSAAPAGAATSWTPRAATYGIAKATDVDVTMSDGVTLKADVLRPAKADGSPAAGTFPVVIGQTPYNKNSGVEGLTETSSYLVTRGYMQVIVDVRGTGSSGGEWDSFGLREQKDYQEVATWARALPGSNGDLALYGISYGGIDTIFTAAGQPKGLKAAFPIVPAGDSYRDVVANGGQIDTGFIPFWMGLVTATSLVPPTTTPTDPISALENAGSHALGATHFQVPTIVGATTGEDQGFDGPFYRTRSPLEVIDRVNVPTFVVGGEKDLFQRGEPMLYNALRRRGIPTRLLIGDWTHLQAGDGVGLPADGVPVLNELLLRWFDHYVKDVADPTLDTDIAQVTTKRIGSGSGSGHYERTTSYPAPDTHYTALRLGGTSAPGTTGTLGGTHSPGTGTVPYLPIAGVCSQSTSQWTAGALPVNAPCANDNRYNDLLGATYDLQVTGKPLTFMGTSTAHLFVSTSATEGSLAVRLEDLDPSGKSKPLSTGWQVLSLRALDLKRSVLKDGLMVQPYHPYTKASALPVVADTIYQVDVEIFPTTAQVAPGHSLRLAIQGADAPHLTSSVPGTVGGALGTITVHADDAHPSSLVLGVQHATASTLGLAAPGAKPPAAAAPTRTLASTGASLRLAALALLLVAAAAFTSRRPDPQSPGRR